jgi:hypothetical protein
MAEAAAATGKIFAVGEEEEQEVEVEVASHKQSAKPRLSASQARKRKRSVREGGSGDVPSSKSKESWDDI